MSDLNKYGELDAQKCAGCGQPVEPNWNHCPQCGRVLRKVCDGCGKPMEADWIVCPRCGAASKVLDPSSATPQAVSVTVDQLALPGTMVSGGVTFSDGMKADWHLDQTGRLGLKAKQQGYKPSPEDIQQFQAALEREMAKLGF